MVNGYSKKRDKFSLVQSGCHWNFAFRLESVSQKQRFLILTLFPGSWTPAFRLADFRGSNSGSDRHKFPSSTMQTYLIRGRPRPNTGMKNSSSVQDRNCRFLFAGRHRVQQHEYTTIPANSLFGALIAFGWQQRTGSWEITCVLRT